MKRTKAFTLPEILIVVILVTAVLGVVYKLFSGAMSQLFKSSYKMTNLRAATIILEKLKNDVRCSTIPKEGDNIVVENKKLVFMTTSFEADLPENLKETPREVKYELVGDELKRTSASKQKNVTSSAKVINFIIAPEKEGDLDNSNFIKVTIEVDNEKDSSTRSISSKNNSIKLEAVMYPRFLEKARTDEEKYWFNGR